MKEFIEKTTKDEQTLKIAIDGNEANISNRVGSNVYAFEIIKNLYNIVRNKPVKVTILLSTPPINNLPKENKKWKYQVITPQKFWTQWALPIHLFFNSNQYDVFYTPGHYAPRLSSIPYVSSVMDLAFLKFRKQFKKRDLIQLEKWTKYSVKNAKKVITISDYSKQDIIKEYKKKETDIAIAYPAVYPPKRKIAPVHIKKVLKKFHIEAPYILYIGTIQPRKNLINLIDSFEKVSRKLPIGKRKKIEKLQLVIAGKIGWLADDLLKRVENSPYKNQIILTGFVTNFEKEILISKANTLSLVGLYEGFGIPPLEALHHEIIPVVSNSSSLPEVVGKAGLLADPNKPIDIAEKLEKVLTLTTKQKQEYLKHRRTQIDKFNWKNSAKIVYKTLEKVANDYSRN
jgi:glycosyltransferase involved in cell wall biosynthesis